VLQVGDATDAEAGNKDFYRSNHIYQCVPTATNMNIPLIYGVLLKVPGFKSVIHTQIEVEGSL
jgi:hypothetical protein